MAQGKLGQVDRTNFIANLPPYEIYDIAEHPGIVPGIFIIINLIIIYILYTTITIKHNHVPGRS